jgi:hypothetical protein
MDAPGGLVGFLTMAGLVIGLITGFGTVIGWIASANLPSTLTTTGKVGIILFSGTGTIGTVRANFELVALWWRDRVTLLALTLIYAGIGVSAFLIPWDEWLFQVIGTMGLLVLAGYGVFRALRWHGNYLNSRKTCPECAESVKVEAKICKHCHSRF